MRKYLILLAVLGAATPAIAQELTTEGGMGATTDFTSVDADANGSVTFEELQAVVPDLTEDLFAKADGDANGFLSGEEFAAYMSTQTLTTQ